MAAKRCKNVIVFLFRQLFKKNPEKKFVFKKLMVDFSHYNKTLRALSNVGLMDLRVLKNSNYNRDILKLTMSSLFCLIQFYEQKTGYIQYKTDSKLPVIHFFPLMLRPFGKYWLPTPRNPVYLLSNEFADIENLCGPSGAPCKDLKTRYPFVDRAYHSPHISYERLKISGITISEIEFQN
jgi:hypothetical protein